MQRMLDKSKQPSFDDMIKYCGASGTLWLEFEQFLKEIYNLEKMIRFPYGKDYGWSVKYTHGSKHICDVFAEKDSFVVFFKIYDKDISKIKHELGQHATAACDEKYPCNNGGWVEFGVTEQQHLYDAQKLITAKVAPKKK